MGQLSVAKASTHVVRELEQLHRRLHVVYCTATSVQLSLLSDISDANRELAVCMGHHIVSELCEIGQAGDSILIELGGKPQFADANDLAE